MCGIVLLLLGLALLIRWAWSWDWGGDSQIFEVMRKREERHETDNR